MAVLLSRLIPLIVVLSLVFGAYKLWMWAVRGGLSRVDRARAVFFVMLAMAIAIVIVSKML